MISFPDQLADLVTLVVPAGRGTAALAPLLESLCRAATVAGYARPPRLVVGVFESNDADAIGFTAWRAAGGTVTLVTAAAGHATAVRNAAIAAVSSRWIAFLDDDVVAETDYLSQLEAVCRAGTAPVIQGVPFLCDNAHKVLARLEARNYEQGFATYHDRATNTVRVIDARNLVMTADTARAFPFDERLLFAGEGQELGRRLEQAGVRMAYCESLRVRHRNRDTVAGLAIQKFLHGRGRAQRVAREEGVWNHARRSVFRHFVSPVSDAVFGRLAFADMGYRLFTNTMFWGGVTYEALRRPRDAAPAAGETA
ncbi:MAG: glycosyltransferase family 2 protein [Planctomycetia bacterium]